MPAPSPLASATSIAGPLSLGNRGKDVQTLQALLNKATVPGPGLTEDGIFGSRTDAVVRAFQRRRGLASDGIVGQRTTQALGARFVEQNRPLPRPDSPGTFPPSSNVTPAAVMVGVIAKELKQIANAIENSFDNGFDEKPEVFNRAKKFLKSGLNQALSRLVSAARGGLAGDLVAFEVGSALLLMVGGLGVVAGELDKGGAESSNVTAILTALASRIPNVREVVRRTLAGQLEGGARAGSKLLRDLLDPLSR